MRFFASVLSASLMVLVAGVAADRRAEAKAEPVVIKETCRGMIHWSEDGFFRSGSTVRYHGHMWQCSRWNKGENPETSDIWKDLGPCDPDVLSQVALSKRSALSMRDINDDHPYCHGYRQWAPNTLNRSGATVVYDGSLYQSSTWTKTRPGTSKEWKIIGTCRVESSKTKRSQCDGVPEYDDKALYRSGTEVEYKTELYQSHGWTKGVAPTNAKVWTHLGHC